MGFESLSPKEVGMNDALAALASIEAEVHAMGANDSELARHGELAQIRMMLEKGELSPEDAIARAEGVKNSKQAYH